jgi:hypothetical protein
MLYQLRVQGSVESGTGHAHKKHSVRMEAES